MSTISVSKTTTNHRWTSQLTWTSQQQKLQVIQQKTTGPPWRALHSSNQGLVVWTPGDICFQSLRRKFPTDWLTLNRNLSDINFSIFSRCTRKMSNPTINCPPIETCDFLNKTIHWTNSRTNRGLVVWTPGDLSASRCRSAVSFAVSFQRTG